MRISDWSSDVCSSDLPAPAAPAAHAHAAPESRSRARGRDQLSVQYPNVIPAKAGTHLPRQAAQHVRRDSGRRSEEHTSELQSLMRISYAVFCLKKKKNPRINYIHYRKIAMHIYICNNHS